METDLRQSVARAGMKLAGGLFLIAAILGIRIVMATPEGVESEIAELEAAESAWSAEGPESGSESAPKEAAVERSRPVFTRPSDSSPDADRLVACDLGGTTQFMRAADCGTRGGDSIDVKPRAR